MTPFLKSDFPNDAIIAEFKKAVSVAHRIALSPHIPAVHRSKAAAVISDFTSLFNAALEVATFDKFECFIQNMAQAEDAFREAGE